MSAVLCMWQESVVEQLAVVPQVRVVELVACNTCGCDTAQGPSHIDTF
jgi:hypothetical protein